jgi:subtilisin family serine protease
MRFSSVRLALPAAVLFLCAAAVHAQGDAPSLDLPRAAADKVLGEVKGGGPEIYIVQLEGEPVATYRGGIAGLPATSPAVTGARRLDAGSAASRAYEAHLASSQARFLGQLAAVLGRSPDLRFQYRHAFNGIAVVLSPDEARRVAAMDGVVQLHRDHEEQLLTDAGPEFIGATTPWGGGLTALDHHSELSGANEVPAVVSTASGIGTFSYNIGNRQLSYSISTSGLTATAAHIHEGAAGVNGPVLLTLDHTANPMVGVWALSEADAGKLANGLLYVNVHTAAFPGGEIRDQIRISGTLGEGIIVGILDSGINQGHPSFAAVAGDGYAHVNPFGSGNYVGHCVANPSFCNDKLIGAWALHPSSATPADADGHGSHTASTAAGNIRANPAFVAPTQSYQFPFLSGVAPRASIIAYQVCFPSCPITSTTAAVNQALIDGVDVINYSISGGTNPYGETTALAFRNAVAAGVVVAASAGNSGPGAATVGHQGPWVMTVAASTHNREILNVVTNLTSSGGPLPDIFGESPTAAYGPASLVYAGAAPFNNPLCNPFPAGTFSGQIVVCDRGTIGRVQKGANVLAAGTGGMILANDAPSAASLNADAHVLPATHISFADGVVLKNWMASGSGHQGAISGGTVDLGGPGDNMASFSSRGPAGASVPGLANLVKPDVSAPGLNILAAFRAGFSAPPEFNIISGTSMSSPHAAGAAALLRALYPDWTPPEIKSALMITSASGVRKEDNTTSGDPFDFGAGRVELRTAPDAGFVLDITDAEFVAANPATGGDPRLLNLASMATTACTGSCTWTRTLRSVRDHSQQYSASVAAPPGSSGSVVPSSFTLPPGGAQTLEVTLVPGSAAFGTWMFAELQIEADGAVADAEMPIAARPQPSNLPTRVVIQAQASSGTHMLRDVTAIQINELSSTVSGLVEGATVTELVAQDPTQGNPYNFDGGTFHVTLVVPLGARRLVAEIIASEAPDADLFVGTGVTPSSATQVCAGVTASAIEYCNISNPLAGTWWVLVQNWQGSANQPDAITLVTAVVPEEGAGNMVITGPASVPAGEPFDLGIQWNSPSMQALTRWYGSFTVGSDAGTPDNLGRVGVDLIRGLDAAIFADGFEGND